MTEPKRSLPALDATLRCCYSPHVVILGAGASRKACPEGDANGRVLPLMADLVEVTGLQPLLRKYKLPERVIDFEILYQELWEDSSSSEAREAIESHIQTYFEQLQLPPTVTFYDQLLLSLREKDVIVTFNWDPLLPQAFKRNRHVCNLPHLVFLHGNVDVGACNEHRTKGFLEHGCSECQEPLSRSKLLYPIARKDYNADPLIANEWSEVGEALRYAYIITIIGYRAPESDVEAKDLLLTAWQQNRSREFGELDIVDIRSREELESEWQRFFVRTHYGISTHPHWLFKHARRSCDHFAMATLQQRPCHDNPLLDTNNLLELQEWAVPYVREERLLEEDGRPFDC